MQVANIVYVYFCEILNFQKFSAHDRRRKNGSNKLLDDGMLIVVKSQENDVFGVWTSIPLKFREEVCISEEKKMIFFL